MDGSYHRAVPAFLLDRDHMFCGRHIMGVTYKEEGQLSFAEKGRLLRFIFYYYYYFNFLQTVAHCKL